MNRRKTITAAIAGLLLAALAALYIVPGFSAEVESSDARAGMGDMAMMANERVEATHGTCNMEEMSGHCGMEAMPEACNDKMASHNAVMSPGMHGGMAMHGVKGDMGGCPMMAGGESADENDQQHTGHH